ncbi:hypothetical protein RvY_01840-4 [Ramazzottius varieornatus]|uniref:Uncharacterized protein n=1 Tax=Ramazzottius varieornatus TaxID=947166 RepID=A0A1D1UIJ8_RAMVA|nr:hypothetical protein RvY_01840-4 [Ramazzottius varieornatus]
MKRKRKSIVRRRKLIRATCHLRSDRNESQQADKTSFKQLVDNSDIWVDSAVLKALYETSPSLTKYAMMLVWDVILTLQDILTMNQRKSQSVGFVKLFGEWKFRNVYGSDKKE